MSMTPHTGCVAYMKTNVNTLGMEKLFIYDFDGVISFLFERYDLVPHRKEMLETLLCYGLDASKHENMFTVSELIESSDLPMDVKQKAFLDVDRILKNVEMEAIRNAEPVPGLMEIFPKVVDAGVHVAVASNNNPEAVKSYLEKLFPEIEIPVWGRNSLHPEWLKPSPYMLERAIEYYGAERENTIFFGDAVSDYEAALNAGVGFYGFIPSEKKKIRMEKVLPRDRLLLDWHELSAVLLS